MLYDYCCRTCGSTVMNVYAKIADRHDAAPECCGEKMQIAILEAPYGFVDNMEAYASPVDGTHITTRRQRKYEMEKGGYIDANDFAKTHAQRKAEQEKKQAEIQAIKDAVPDDLKKTMQQVTKSEAKKFKDSL